MRFKVICCFKRTKTNQMKKIELWSLPYTICWSFFVLKNFLIFKTTEDFCYKLRNVIIPSILNSFTFFIFCLNISISSVDTRICLNHNSSIALLTFNYLYFSSLYFSSAKSLSNSCNLGSPFIYIHDKNSIFLKKQKIWYFYPFQLTLSDF